MNTETGQSTQQPTQQNKNSMKLIMGLIAIALIATVSFTVLTPKNKPKEIVVTDSSTPKQEETVPTEEAIQAGAYKNGKYQAVGEYSVPGNKEQIGISLTIADDVITSADIEQLAKLPFSKQMQADFTANFKDQVIGKNIDEVKLIKVSGSSLTPKGFNDALEQIKVKAKS